MYRFSRKKIALAFGLSAAGLLLAGAPAYRAFVAAWPRVSAFFYRVPRTSFGDPDLQGLWNNTSLTNLERFAEFPELIVPPSRVLEFEELATARHKKSLDFYHVRPGTHAKKFGLVGYDNFWSDLDRHIATIRGEFRSSWIVDPPDGRVPYRREAVKAAKQRILGLSEENPEGPEYVPLAERCLVGYGSTSGPPMLNVEYNNNYQIVQSPGYVAIVVEMNHDVRLIRLSGQHLPAELRPWMGDSIGHWEGNTLVVETTNMHPAQGFSRAPKRRLFVSPDAKVTEWFTRVSDDEILYRFQVEDPVYYQQPWRGEIPMRASSGLLYEYACHEGNRSMENILAGARYSERVERSVKP